MDWSKTPLDLQLSSPLQTASGRISSRSGFVLRLQDRGQVGLGESLPLEGWTESHGDCDASLDRLCQAISEVETPVDAPVPAGQFLPDPYQRILNDCAEPAARHGVSLALFDLRARLCGESLVGLLGGAPRTVPVNATVGAVDRDSIEAAVTDAVAAGYRTIKCKVGAHSPATDRERITAARQAVGDDRNLRLDVNGSWDVETALEAIEWCAATDIEYLEQPLPADELEANRALTGRGVSIGLDESLYEHGVEAVLGAGACSIVVCKPMALGGIDRVVRLASRLRAAGIEPVVTTTIDGVVATAGAAHAAAAIDPTYACGLGTISHFDSTEFDPSSVSVTNGSITVSPAPGLGIDT